MPSGAGLVGGLSFSTVGRKDGDAGASFAGRFERMAWKARTTTQAIAAAATQAHALRERLEALIAFDAALPSAA
jgi:hypothetical protein